MFTKSFDSWVFACLWTFLAALSGGPLRSHEGGAREQAAETFQRKFLELRTKQRAALSRAADDFAGELKKMEQDGRMADASAAAGRAAARKLVDILRGSSDLETAVTLSLRLRSSLPAPLGERLTQTVTQFAELAQQLAQAKLDYQPHLAQQIQKRWENADLSEKRALLSEYFSLGGQVPQGLMRRRSAGAAPLPLSPAAAKLFDRFEQRSHSELRTAEQRFLPERQRLKSDLLAASLAADLTAEQTSAIAALVRLLEADYGKGFRGMMLCTADPGLPPALAERVTRFCQQFRAELAAYRTWRDAELSELKKQLAALRARHLMQSEFGPLMAIDLRLHELEYPLRPMWIFAFRRDRTPERAQTDRAQTDRVQMDGERPESAWLLDVRNDQYRVRYRRDDREVWLDRQHVLLGPSPDVPIEELNVPAPKPSDQPALVDQAPLQEGESALCYRGNAWHTVTVLDTSPFGAVIHWDGLDDDYDRVEPRANLRRRLR